MYPEKVEIKQHSEEVSIAKVRERVQSAHPDFSALERLFQQVQKPEPQHIALPIGDGLMFVPVADIVRLQVAMPKCKMLLHRNNDLVLLIPSVIGARNAICIHKGDGFPPDGRTIRQVDRAAIGGEGEGGINARRCRDVKRSIHGAFP